MLRHLGNQATSAHAVVDLSHQRGASFGCSSLFYALPSQEIPEKALNCGSKFVRSDVAKSLIYNRRPHGPKIVLAALFRAPVLWIKVRHTHHIAASHQFPSSAARSIGSASRAAIDFDFPSSATAA